MTRRMRSFRAQAKKQSPYAKMVVCQRCKLPGGLPGMPPLKKVGDAYFHNGQCPKPPKMLKKTQVVVPKAGEIIVPRIHTLPKV